MSKNKVVAPLLMALVMLGALGAGGAYWWLEGRYQESTDNAYVEADMSVMAARVPGYVEEIYVDENQVVAEGQPLFRLNASDYQARVEQAQADLVSRQAAEQTLAEQVRLQDALISQAEAELSSARAEQHRARLDYERYQTLITSRATSAQQLQLVKTQAQKAQASLEAAEANLTAQRQNLRVLRARQQEAQAAVGTARAALKVRQVDLTNTQVYAPVAGMVGNKRVEVGQYLQPGLPAVTVVPLDDLHITANFKETQLSGLRIGQPVQVTVDAYPDQPLTGRILSTAPATGSRFSLLPPENATGNFTKIVQRLPIRVGLPRDNVLQGLLRPGMSVVVDVDTRAPGAPLSEAVAQLFEGESRVAMQ